MKAFISALSALVVAGAAAIAHAETPVPMAASPEEVGLSSVQLKKLEAVTKQQIDDGLVPGAVMLVARRGKIAWLSVQGKRDPAQPDPMKLDSIFRIYSMTKPIVSTTLMQLVEEGRLQISDPVSKYLPEIGNMKVGTEVIGPDGRPVLHLSDPTRPMTVQDLLRHTSGLTYGGRGTSLINASYVDAKIGDRGNTNQEMVSKLSKLALKFNPGDRWEYSVAVDVQGRLIEVLTGKKLSEAVAERVLQPLGMVDSGFQVPADKVARAAQPGPRPNGQPMTPRFKVDDGARYEIGRRRHAEHDGGLSPLHHGAGQRRRLPGQAHHRQADARLHDRRPHRRTAGPSAGAGVRSRLRGPPAGRRLGDRGLGWRVRLGRQRRHPVLDRPEGTAHRNLHGAGE